MNAVAEEFDPPRRIDALDRLTAAFFGVPTFEIPRLQAQDWVAHRAVIVFLVIVVLPLSAVSFGHLSTLILASAGETASLSAEQVYWASALGGGIFGVLLTWLNDSGMTIMLRRPGQSWQKAVGLLSRGLFVALNVLLFTAAITAFSLRDRIELKRSVEGDNKIAQRTKDITQAETALSAAIGQLTTDIARKSKELNEQSPQTANLKLSTEECRLTSKVMGERLQKFREQLRDVDGQMERARSQQDEKLVADLLRRRALRASDVSRASLELSQNQRQCESLAEQTRQSEKEHLADVRRSIAALSSETERKRGELVQAKAQTAETRKKAETQSGLEFGRNLGAEFAALADLLADPKETGARVTAIVVALFFGLIDLMPVLWGWSLREGSVNTFLSRRDDTYVRSITLTQDGIVRQLEADDAADASYTAVRGAEEKVHRQRRALFEARLAAAKQYADAVAALEKMLASEHLSGTSPEIVDRVRQESVEALSATFRATPARERV